MASPAISQAVMSAVESAMAAQFNAKLAAACSDFGIASQSFSMTFTPAPDNGYFRAQYSLDDLRQYAETACWPICCLYSRGSVDENASFPATFSGFVEAGMSWFLRFSGFVQSDMETLPNAVESAIVSVFHGYFTGGVVLRQGSMRLERETPVFQSDCWYVGLHLAAEFDVTV